MSKQDYEVLIETFKKQLEFTKNLIEIADLKLISIRENNTDMLMELTNKEEEFARQIIQLEKHRDSLIKKMEKEQNEKITNISQIIKKLSQEMSGNLILLSEELKYNMEILQGKNNINRELMVFVLEQIEIANNIITGDRVPNTYNNTKFSKNKYTNMQNSYFDTKY